MLLEEGASSLETDPLLLFSLILIAFDTEPFGDLLFDTDEISRCSTCALILFKSSTSGCCLWKSIVDIL